MSERWTQAPRVAVVGGGLAGLAGGCALADAGFRVTLFERRPFLGGRASSYQHPGTGEVVDNCQHVLLGCCTNLVEFYRRLGVEGKIRWYDRLTFLEPGGRASLIEPSSLPAPLHTTPAFLRAACLDWPDKLAIAGAMAALVPMTPRDRGESFLTWLRRHGQTERAIARFWRTVLVSALNEDIDRVSVPSAAQVMRESFLKSPSAGRMGVPTVPLTELYSVAGGYLSARSGEVRLRSGVDGFRAEVAGVRLLTPGGEEGFDFVVLAVPFDVLSRMLPQTSAAEPLRQTLDQLETSPITGIHLWFDRQITDLDHAVLLDRTIQWMFNKGEGRYIQTVVSASRSLLETPRSEIIDLAVRELAEFFPAVKEARLEKAQVIKEVRATFSAKPGLEALRPAARTHLKNFFLAGDWTRSGWQATMEGAVRSGYLAAEAVTEAAGTPRRFLLPDVA